MQEKRAKPAGKIVREIELSKALPDNSKVDQSNHLPHGDSPNRFEEMYFNAEDFEFLENFPDELYCPEVYEERAPPNKPKNERFNAREEENKRKGPGDEEKVGNFSARTHESKVLSPKDINISIKIEEVIKKSSQSLNNSKL